MLDAKTRDSMSRSDIVSYYLRLCALQIDPRAAAFTALAEEINVHPTTVSVWVAQGFVPPFQQKKLQKRFGRKYAPFDDLCAVDA